MNFFASHRSAKALKKFLAHLKTLRHADDDLLDGAQRQQLDNLIAEGGCLRGKPEEARQFLNGADARLDAIVPQKSHAVLREYLDILAVALAVAFGIRGLFFQPFKIPTSSMQPTLYGIHFMNAKDSANPFLGKFPRPVDWMLFSSRRAKLEISDPGTWRYGLERNAGNFLADSTSLVIGDRRYQLPGARDKVLEYSNVVPSYPYQAGDVLCDGYLSTGDHLFVDRVSHYYTGLKRGDVIVFNTEGITTNGRKLADISGFYYIKRLVGLPGDTLKIDAQGLHVKPAGENKFRHITELSPKFERLYSDKGGYQGHSNIVGNAPGRYLGRPEETFTVPEDCYFMLGDNTKFSADSRVWGVVPRKNIVGKAFLIFWPISRRWGIADTRDALDIPTGADARGTFPSMYFQ